MCSAHIVGVVQVAAERVVNQAAEKGDVGAGADGYIAVRHRGGAIEARVDADQLGFALALGLHDEAEADRMVLGGIAAHHQNDVGVGDVGPAIGHGASSERGGQTGHRGAVSKPGLVFVGENAETEAKLAEQVS